MKLSKHLFSALLYMHRDCFVPRIDVHYFNVNGRTFRPKQSKNLYQIRIILCLLLSLTFLPSLILAQTEVLSSLEINQVVAEKWNGISQQNYKMLSSIDPINLPFLDDFSKESVYPDTALWIDRAAFINRTYPKAPITLGVATLDGLDSTGYPYNFGAAENSTGIADHLTSKPINMGAPLTPTDNIYLSFFYQAKGYGDYPQARDTLMLEFRTPTKNWMKVWYKNGYTPADNDSSFQLVMIPITDTAYLKNGFQFRFKNYATLSGSFDHWHIDYVYLNKSRNMNDTIFDDAAFVYDAPSLLNNYREIPWNHYVATDMKTSINMFMRNNDNIVKNTTYTYYIKDQSGNVKYNYPISPANMEPYFSKGYNSESKHANPTVNYSFPTLTDTTVFEIEHILKATPDKDRWNDTVRFYQKFRNYYAYDDGSAEAAYSLNESNAKAAYKFTINTPDTLRAVQFYFIPRITNASLYSFRIAIWDDFGGYPGKLIYQDSVVYPKYEKGLNQFHTYLITNPALILKGTFYVGWIQESNKFLNVGFDKNTDTQNNIFYNVSGGWYPGSYKGSLMIRPVFGKAISGTEPFTLKKSSDIGIYPNPATDKLYITNEAHVILQLSLFDYYGRMVFYDKNFNGESIDLSSFSNGIYFIRIDDGKNIVFTKKLMVNK